MKNRALALIVGVLAVGGITMTGAGNAHAAQTETHGNTTYIVFTHDETMKIAGTGVESILDDPAVRPYWSAGPDPKSRDVPFFVPGRGLMVRTSAQRLVEEAAQKDGGRVIVGITNRDAPITLITRWPTQP
ncbi:hypothetical protein [Gordonia sp. NPDC003429]